MADYVRGELEERVDKWLAQAGSMSGGAELGYVDKKDGTTRGLLAPASLAAWGDFTCLNSLRDVEPSINLILNDFGMDRDAPVPVSADGDSAPAGPT